MGIRYLNSLLNKKCKKSIKKMNLSCLSNKTIVIDVSIYLYKLSENGKLIEEMNELMCIFKKYNIIAVFVFDGIPPNEKNDILKKRHEEKIKSENEYKLLEKQLQENQRINELNLDESSCESSNESSCESSCESSNESFRENRETCENIRKKMSCLKKNFIYISKQQIKDVKECILQHNFTYIESPEEADEVCAKLVIGQKAWGCLSEDMDLFVYGCNRVFRSLDLVNHTVVCYNTKKILYELSLTQKDFREICILSGSDYLTNKNKVKKKFCFFMYIYNNVYHFNFLY
jgi:5'-3' exonuclease